MGPSPGQHDPAAIAAEIRDKELPRLQRALIRTDKQRTDNRNVAFGLCAAWIVSWFAFGPDTLQGTALWLVRIGGATLAIVGILLWRTSHARWIAASDEWDRVNKELRQLQPNKDE